MYRNEKKRGNPALGLLVLAAIGFLNVFGLAGLLLIAAVAMAGTVVWGVLKAGRQNDDTGDDTGRPVRRVDADRYPAGAPARRTEADRYPAGAPARRADAARYPAAGNMREDYRQRTEALQDLLKAGIIDQAEYHDRAAQLRDGR